MTFGSFKILWNQSQYLCPSKYTLWKKHDLGNAYHKLYFKVVNVDKWAKTIHWILTSPLPFFFWLDGNNSRFKSHLDNNSKERFYNQRVPESKSRRTKAVDKGILITYRFSDRKFPKPIITMSSLPQEQGTWNNSAKLFFHQLLAIAKWRKSFGESWRYRDMITYCWTSVKSIKTYLQRHMVKQSW